LFCNATNSCRLLSNANLYSFGSHATAAFRERTDTCIAGDDGPGNWYKGYHDAQRDFLGRNGHGYDASTHLKGEQGDIYVAGYQDGWADAQKGVTMPAC
jgi:hypothetical protein